MEVVQGAVRTLSSLQRVVRSLRVGGGAGCGLGAQWRHIHVLCVGLVLLRICDGLQGRTCTRQ